MKTRQTALAGFVALAGIAGCVDDARDTQSNDPLTESDDSAFKGWFGGGKPHHDRPDGSSGNEDCADAAAPDASAADATVPDAEVPTAPTCSWKRYDEGLSGGAVSFVQYDHRNPTLAYATVGETLYKSRDRGASWQLQGTLPHGAFIRVDPYGADPAELIASTSYGVARSSDYGKTWTAISLQGVPALVTSAESQPLRVYAASPGAGIFRSEDGGKHFAAPGSSFPYSDPRWISVDPREPNVAVAGVAVRNALGGWASGAVARTEDGGATWQTVLEAQYWINGVARCRANPDVLYAPFNTGLARSDDNGKHWRELPVAVESPINLTDDVAISATDCDDLYINQYKGGPRRSTDGGVTFGPRLINGLQLVPQGGAPGNIAVDPAEFDHALIATHGGIYETVNGGASWTLKPNMYALAIRAFSTSPQDPERLWLATWGSGVWSRENGATPWARIPASVIPIDFSLTIAADPYVPDRIVVGGIDGNFVSNDGAQFAPTSIPGNVMDVVYDPSNPQVIYAATQINGIYKSTNGGETFALSNGALTPWDTAAGRFIDVRHLAVDPKQPSTIYAGTVGKGVLKSDNGGSSWNSALNGVDPVECLIVVAGEPSRIYACANGVQTSNDGGATWHAQNDGLPTLAVQALVHDAASNTLFASTPTGVYAQRADGSWEGVDRSCLSSTGAMTILRGQAGPRLVVAGSQGVFYRPL